jgi:small ligand-binding sensory domain FIST
MKWCSAISEASETGAALDEALARIGRTLATPQLAIVFATPRHASTDLGARVRRALPGATVIGCSARGVIGGSREIEGAEALSLTCAELPGVERVPIRFDARFEPSDELDEDRSAVFAHVQERVTFPGDASGAAGEPHFLLLADPFTCPTDRLLRALDRTHPRSRKVGGLASAGARPGENLLWLDADAFHTGAVALAMRGDLEIDTLVAQGCRPIGRPLTVTRGEGHRIDELDRRRPLDVIRELFDGLSPPDRELARHSLFIGLEMNEQRLAFSSGELLVRNLTGIDPANGAIAIGAHAHTWQVVQFLLRDARTAEQDLVAHLERYTAGGAQPAGALLFSCLGRGRHLFGVEDHDTGLFAQRLGPVPLGGFFCNGEIGPVGGTTFLHGYTSAFGLFRARSHSAT